MCRDFRHPLAALRTGRQAALVVGLGLERAQPLPEPPWVVGLRAAYSSTWAETLGWQAALAVSGSLDLSRELHARFHDAVLAELDALRCSGPPPRAEHLPPARLQQLFFDSFCAATRWRSNLSLLRRFQLTLEDLIQDREPGAAPGERIADREKVAAALESLGPANARESETAETCALLLAHHPQQGVLLLLAADHPLLLEPLIALLPDPSGALPGGLANRVYPASDPAVPPAGEPPVCSTGEALLSLLGGLLADVGPEGLRACRPFVAAVRSPAEEAAARLEIWPSAAARLAAEIAGAAACRLVPESDACALLERLAAAPHSPERIERRFLDSTSIMHHVRGPRRPRRVQMQGNKTIWAEA
jgi:hypothetical protein